MKYLGKKNRIEGDRRDKKNSGYSINEKTQSSSDESENKSVN